MIKFHLSFRFAIYRNIFETLSIRYCFNNNTITLVNNYLIVIQSNYVKRTLLSLHNNNNNNTAVMIKKKKNEKKNSEKKTKRERKQQWLISTVLINLKWFDEWFDKKSLSWSTGATVLRSISKVFFVEKDTPYYSRGYRGAWPRFAWACYMGHRHHSWLVTGTFFTSACTYIYVLHIYTCMYASARACVYVCVCLRVCVYVQEGMGTRRGAAMWMRPRTHVQSRIIVVSTGTGILEYGTKER